MNKYLITIQIIETGQEFTYELINKTLYEALLNYCVDHSKNKDFEVISIKKIENL